MIELRPAFDGYSGIPQETRLLFWGLATLSGVEVTGLMQSSNLVADPGLPVRRGRPVDGLPTDQRMNQLSRVVISLQQGPRSNRASNVLRKALRLLGPASDAVGAPFGKRVTLGSFEAVRFKDFVWRAMFAKSLPAEDLELVTSRTFRVLRWPWSAMHAVGYMSAMLGKALYARLDTTGIDIFIAETPYPARTSSNTRMVVRYHDAIPLLMPHTTKQRDYHRAAHYNALRRNARDGAWFACVSDASRHDLLSVMPELDGRAVTIPNMIPPHFFNEASRPERVPEVIWSRKNRDAPHAGGAGLTSADLVDGCLSYLLMVGTIEPRKNHLGLLEAWQCLCSEGLKGLNLVFVGSLGWDHDAILRRLSPWLQRGGLHLLEDVPASDLRLLYRHAVATVCPSFGEGFDFPGVEAMRCGGVVVGSDIPVHRGVFSDACEYFDPYSTPAFTTALRTLTGTRGLSRRRELIEAGARVSSRYLPERVLPQWLEFLEKVSQ